MYKGHSKDLCDLIPASGSPIFSSRVNACKAHQPKTKTTPENAKLQNANCKIAQCKCCKYMF